MKKIFAFLLLVFSTVVVAQVAVDQLPSVSSVQSSDYTIDDQSGTTSKATFLQVLQYLEQGLITGTPVTGNCTKWTSSTTLGDSGAPCSSGGGSGTVTTTGSPASGDIAAFSGATSITTATTSGTGSTVLLQGGPTITTPTISGNLTTNIANGSTQCVQANGSGVLSGTGSACGSGGGSGTVTTTGSPASGNLTAFSGSTSITPATASNVTALFAGCTGIQPLGADGSCHASVTSPASAIGNIPYFTTTATPGNLSADAYASVNNGTFTLGATGFLGSVVLDGSTSGAVTIQPQATAGTYNFNLPTTAGTSGYLLSSGGGGASPMTWVATTGSGPQWALTSNSETGYTAEIKPSSTTGANALATYGGIDFGININNTTGAFYNDFVPIVGYNIGNNANYTQDPFAVGEYFDSNYELVPFINAVSGTATSVNSTTLTDTTSGGGSAWVTNQFVGYTLYNVTQGLSAKITANTGTTITGTLTGWSGTPAYKILENDMFVTAKISQQTSSGNVRTFTPATWGFNRGFAQAQGALGTNGNITVVSITASGGTQGGMLINTGIVPHGLNNTSVVRLINATGTSVSTTAGFSNGSAVITATNTFVAGQPVKFTTTGTLPTNFSTSTQYYVISTGLSGSQFEVSASIGGTAVSAGSSGSGTQTVVTGTVAWSNINNQQLAVYTDTTNCSLADQYHFCIGNPIANFQQYTANSATYQAEPELDNVSEIQADANNGLSIYNATWDNAINNGSGGGDHIAACGGGKIAKFLQSAFYFCTFGYNEYNELWAEAGISQAADLVLGQGGGRGGILYGNKGGFQFKGNYNNTQNASGDSVLGYFYQANSSPGDVKFVMGTGLENNGAFNINQVGLTASTHMIFMDEAASMTGAIMYVRYGGSSYTCCALKIDATGLYTGSGMISGSGNATQFTLSSGTGGCATTGTLVGGSTAGKFNCTSTAGVSTVVINLPTAPNGWTCSGSDLTDSLVLIQTASAVSSCTVKVTTATNPATLTFMAIGY